MVGLTFPVYISCQKHYDLLVGFLESVKAAVQIKIIAVINHVSSEFKDDAFTTLARFDCRIEMNPRGNSVPAAWNHGISVCFDLGIEFVIVANTDIVLKDSCIDNLHAFWSATKLKHGLWCARPLNSLAELESTLPEDVSVEAGLYSLFAVSKSSIERLKSLEREGGELYPGMFDENYAPAYFEDNDYDRRLYLVGLLPAATHSALYWHLGSQTIKNDHALETNTCLTFERNRKYFNIKWGVLPSGRPDPYFDGGNIGAFGKAGHLVGHCADFVKRVGYFPVPPSVLNGQLDCSELDLYESFAALRHSIQLGCKVIFSCCHSTSSALRCAISESGLDCLFKSSDHDDFKVNICSVPIDLLERCRGVPQLIDSGGQNMKLLYVTTSESDYLANSLCDGLRRIPDIELEVVSSGSYVEQTLVDWAEKIVVTSGSRVPVIRSPLNYQHKIALVDGADESWPVLDIPSFVYLKRECRDSRTMPISFCTPVKDIVDFSTRDIDVFFAVHLPSNPMRRDVCNALESFRGKYNIISIGTVDGNGRISKQEFDSTLARSKIGISVHGAGQDTLRYWEIPAAGALLLTQRMDIKINNDFNKIDGDQLQEAVQFSDIDEMLAKIDWMLSNPSLMEAISVRGRMKSELFHVPTSRASELVDSIDFGFTENWYNDNQIEELCRVVDDTNGIVGEIIEIGCWEGKSTVGLANKAYPANVIAVDTWRGNFGESESHPTVVISSQRNVYARFIKNMAKLTSGNVVVFRQDCHEFLAKFDSKIRMCHIDACHNYEEVKRTIVAAILLLADGGILCGDDIATADKSRVDLNGGVERAVEELCPGFVKIGNFWKWRKQ